ncbi:MAG: MFS transporter [Armatimonadetes bacterium]|nr:MFS transporter [Armatimonadota bacterium]
MRSESLSPVQVRGFVAAWLGWAFDGLDSVLYTLVAIPFVTLLLGSGATADMAKGKAALIQAFFMFGWAIGGALFGRVGDRIGRMRTLTITIFIYAAFTGLSAIATSWQELLVFRFLAALGIGGEWAAGSSLVAETLPRHMKSWASALLQTGYQTGMIGASLVVAWLPAVLTDMRIGSPGDQYRLVFVIGILPALLTFWIRKAVPEPEEWHTERQHREMPKVTQLFSPAVRSITFRALGFMSIALTTVWTFIFFNTQVIRSHPEVVTLGRLGIEATVGSVTIWYLLWNIAGNFAATYTARKFGIRTAFSVFMFGAMLSAWIGFSTPHDLAQTRMWINLLAFFSLGIFGIFPLYIPLLFPVLLRTTAAGFCYNMGRVVAGLGTLWAAQVVKSIGTAKPIAYVGLLFIPGILLALTMPDSKAFSAE